MTFAAADWPEPLAHEPLSREPLAPEQIAAATTTTRRGSVIVQEIVKISGLVRVQAVLGACLVVPFIAAVAFRLQDSVPADTLFGQWVHQSGYALAMVVLGFAGQWLLPLIVCLVAGDVFASEDRYGTWKTLLSRSRSRGEIFTAKTAAAIAWTLASWLVITAASLGAAAVVGLHPVVGLGGQLVAPHNAWWLVLSSWAVQLPPMIAFASLAILLSVISRNSVVGIGAPVLLGLVCQLTTLVDIPTGLRLALPSTAFAGWHGLWVPAQFLDPIWHGAVTSAVWCAVALTAAWLVFSRRSVRVAA